MLQNFTFSLFKFLRLLLFFTLLWTTNAQNKVYSPICLQCTNANDALDANDKYVTEFDVFYETSSKDNYYCSIIYSYYKTAFSLTDSTSTFYTNKTENGKYTVCAIYSNTKCSRVLSVHGVFSGDTSVQKQNYLCSATLDTYKPKRPSEITKVPVTISEIPLIGGLACAINGSYCGDNFVPLNKGITVDQTAICNVSLVCPSLTCPALPAAPTCPTCPTCPTLPQPSPPLPPPPSPPPPCDDCCQCHKCKGWGCVLPCPKCVLPVITGALPIVTSVAGIITG